MFKGLYTEATRDFRSHVLIELTQTDWYGKKNLVRHRVLQK